MHGFTLFPLTVTAREARREPRGFRLDRIASARRTTEPVPPRDLAGLLTSAAAGALLT